MQLVVMLYEQAIQDLREAARAIEQNNIELRTNKINHAILVLAHLQSGLDFSKGGKVSQDLNHFYDVLRQNLMQVQFKPTEKGIAYQITDLLSVREAWTEVERVEKTSATTGVGTGMAPSDPNDPEADPVTGHWNG